MDMAAERGLREQRGSTSFRNRPILGNPVGPAQGGYAHPGEFGQIIPAETCALYSWDEGRSFVHAWSRTFGEPESTVVLTAPPISAAFSEPKNRLDFY